MSTINIRRRAVLLLISTVFLFATPAEAQTTIGFYFDDGTFSNTTINASQNTVVEAHLVLKNSMGDYGVKGWELRAGLDDMGTFLGWEYAGQVINIMDPPDFAVGIAEPLPYQPSGVWLATAQILINQAVPTKLSLSPILNPSIPGTMGYLDGLDGTDILPMYTSSGQPEVAVINPDAPGAIVSPTVLDFLDVPVGYFRTADVTVTNIGGSDLYLDITLSTECTDYSLPTINGSYVLPAGTAVDIPVRFTPADLGVSECTLSLGSPYATAAQLTGLGREGLVSWQSPASLYFQETPIGSTIERSLVVRNTGELPFLVTPTLPETCTEFALVNGAEPVTVLPGEYFMTLVSFTPEILGEVSCLLDLGDTVPPVELIGIGRDAAIAWALTPSSLEFDEIVLPGSLTMPMTFHNTSEIELEFTVTMAVPEFHFFLDAPVVSMTVPVGEARTFNVHFQPGDIGTFANQILLDLPGAVPVDVTGSARNPIMSWTLTPDPLVFPTMTLPGSQMQYMMFRNDGEIDLDFTVTMAEADAPIRLETPVVNLNVPLGQTGFFYVHFVPTEEGDYTNQILLSLPGAVPLEVSGSAITAIFDCMVSPTEIAFPVVTVGTGQVRSVKVYNTGNQTLVLAPGSSSPHFTVQDQTLALAAGDSTILWITFSPLEAGFLETDIQIGGGCSTVHCTGTGDASWGWEEDALVGLYFDTGYNLYSVDHPPAYPVFSTYLVLKGIPEGSTLGGWECRLEYTDEVAMLGVDYGFEALNVLSMPSFLVGIAEPRPYEPEMLLATIQFISVNQTGETVFSLFPLHNPSIADEMAWLLGGDTNIIRPMVTPTGDPAVAWIQDNLVANETPTPALSQANGRIQVSWPRPSGLYQGCNIYRRIEDETASRLNDRLLTTEGEDIVFTDPATGLQPGVRLFYSYALVRDDMEVARSPEVETRFNGVPIARTRLLANIPNPFNPLTEIHFELEQPGNTRVGIYDVTGRRVATLADGSLGAGRHMRTWNGLDDGGRRVPSGAYYVRLETSVGVDHRKIMLLK